MMTSDTEFKLIHSALPAISELCRWPHYLMTSLACNLDLCPLCLIMAWPVPLNLGTGNHI